jgi:hypothetical protein
MRILVIEDDHRVVGELLQTSEGLPVEFPLSIVLIQRREPNF